MPHLPLKPSAITSSPDKLLRGKGGSHGRSSCTRRTLSPLVSAGDPTSPKVTCIGQVRIQRNSNASIRSDSQGDCKGGETKRKLKIKMRCCFATSKPLIPAIFRWRQSFWRRWRLPLKKDNAGGYRRPSPEAEIPLPLKDVGETERRIGFCKEPTGREEDEEYDQSEARVFVQPINALILMRCRSAPHNRSSALAIGCSAASSKAAEDEVERVTKNNEKCEEEEEEEEEEGETSCLSSMPLFLKRSNSEPPR